MHGFYGVLVVTYTADRRVAANHDCSNAAHNLGSAPAAAIRRVRSTNCGQNAACRLLNVTLALRSTVVVGELFFPLSLGGNKTLPCRW